GKPFVAGVYPMLLDETCFFLAVDFDKSGWLQDSTAFMETGHRMGLSAALERSRSGRGGHVWLFFEEAVPAALARKLGSHILTETMESRPDIGLDSVSWRGTIAQYVGRLHRLYDGKREVRVYDYADLNVPMLARMFDRRCQGYEAIGYTIVVPASAIPGWPADVVLPADPIWKRDYAASVRRLVRDGVDAPLANLFVTAARPDSSRSRRRQSRAERKRSVPLSAARNLARDSSTIRDERRSANRVRRLGPDGSRPAVHRFTSRR
ncbi:MAG: TOTE conflict system archaeo-eukaryotic primase domain-containing protein, partial [Vicinamibacterales bacterium]